MNPNDASLPSDYIPLPSQAEIYREVAKLYARDPQITADIKFDNQGNPYRNPTDIAKRNDPLDYDL